MNVCMDSSSDRKLIFFKNKINQALDNLRQDIGELRYKLYKEMVKQCNDYEELKEMAELEMQIDSVNYTKEAIKNKLSEHNTDVRTLRRELESTKDAEEDLEFTEDAEEDLEVSALNLQRMLAEQEITEEERIANMLLAEEEDEAELIEDYGEQVEDIDLNDIEINPEDFEAEADYYEDEADSDGLEDINNPDEFSDDLINECLGEEDDQGIEENEDDFDEEEIDIEGLEEYSEEYSDDEALNSENNFENEFAEDSLSEYFTEDEDNSDSLFDEDELSGDEPEIDIENLDTDELLGDDFELDDINEDELVGDDDIDIDNLDPDELIGDDEEGDDSSEFDLDELNPDELLGDDADEDEPSFDDTGDSEDIDLDSLDPDELLGEDDEESSNEDEIDLEDLDPDELLGDDDEEEATNLKKPQTAASTGTKERQHETFVKGEHAKETQRAFELMSGLQGKIGLFSRKTAKKTVQSAKQHINNSDYYKLPKEDE